MTETPATCHVGLGLPADCQAVTCCLHEVWTSVPHTAPERPPGSPCRWKWRSQEAVPVSQALLGSAAGGPCCLEVSVLLWLVEVTHLASLSFLLPLLEAKTRPRGFRVH